MRQYSQYKDEPKSMRYQCVRAERQHLMHTASHVKGLQAYVNKLQRPGLEVPGFDPLDGGNEARVLFLMEKPGPKTSVENGGSEFISRNNNDPTAANIFNFMKQVGITRENTALWNTIPWWNATIAFTADERKAGINEIPALLCQFPHLCAIVLVGRQAQKAETIITCRHPNLKIFKSPHPSNQAWRYHPEIKLIWREVKLFLDEHCNT